VRLGVEGRSGSAPAWPCEVRTSRRPIRRPVSRWIGCHMSESRMLVFRSTASSGLLSALRSVHGCGCQLRWRSRPWLGLPVVFGPPARWGTGPPRSRVSAKDPDGDPAAANVLRELIAGVAQQDASAGDAYFLKGNSGSVRQFLAAQPPTSAVDSDGQPRSASAVLFWKGWKPDRATTSGRRRSSGA